MQFKHSIKIALMFISILFSGLAFSLSDSAITASVNNRIAADKALSDTTVKVSTSNGNVTLSGNVKTTAQASEATEIAQATTGVKNVDTSKLTVGGDNQQLTDMLITAKVKGSFIQQKLFGEKDVAAMSISVETNNGVVTLSGTADSQEQVDNAVKIARGITGVKDVETTVQVQT